MTRMSKRAERDLEELPAALKSKAENIIGRLQDEPALGKKLLGKLEGKRSVRLGRTHSIIYTVDPLFVLTVVARKDAYR